MKGGDVRIGFRRRAASHLIGGVTKAITAVQEAGVPAGTAPGAQAAGAGLEQSGVERRGRLLFRTRRRRRLVSALCRRRRHSRSPSNFSHRRLHTCVDSSHEPTDQRTPHRTAVHVLIYESRTPNGRRCSAAVGTVL